MSQSFVAENHEELKLAFNHPLETIILNNNIILFILLTNKFNLCDVQG